MSTAPKGGGDMSAPIIKGRRMRFFDAVIHCPSDPPGTGRVVRVRLRRWVSGAEALRILRANNPLAQVILVSKTL